MLILTRRIGEKIMLGDDIEVVVLGVNGNQVKIGINAPNDIAVHREEIYHRIKNEAEQPCTQSAGQAKATLVRHKGHRKNSYLGQNKGHHHVDQRK